jgi:hypothetical protein
MDTTEAEAVSLFESINKFVRGMEIANLIPSRTEVALEASLDNKISEIFIDEKGTINKEFFTDFLTNVGFLTSLNNGLAIAAPVRNSTRPGRFTNPFGVPSSNRLLWDFGAEMGEMSVPSSEMFELAIDLLMSRCASEWNSGGAVSRLADSFARMMSGRGTFFRAR